MFTFSFSSAFATTTYTADQVVAAMSAEANDYCQLIEAQGTAYLKAASTSKVIDGAWNASDATMAKVVADVVAAKKAAFMAKVVNEQASISGTSISESDYNTAVAEVGSIYTTGNYDDCVNSTTVTQLALSIEELKKVKADALAELAAIDGTKYNTSTADADVVQITASNKDVSGLTEGDKVSKRAYVEAIVSTAVKAVNDATIDEADKGTNATTKGNIDTALTNAKDAIAAVKTLEKEASEAKTDAELKAYKIAIMEGELSLAEAKVRKVINDELATLNAAATVDTTAVAKAEKELAALDAQYDAVKEVFTALINDDSSYSANTTPYSCATYSDFGTVETALKAAVTKTEDVDKLEAYAQLLKGATVNGTAKYDSEKIDENLAAAILAVYNGSDYATQYTNLVTGAEIGAAATLAQKNTAITTLESYVSESAYDEAQWAQVEAIVAKATDDIMVANTTTEINKIVEAAKKEMDKVVTTAVHTSDWALAGTLGKEFAKTYQSELAGYAAYAAAKLPATGATAAKTALTTFDTVYTNVPSFAMEIVKEAYTVEEIAGKVAEAKAAIDGLKTDEQLSTAADAVEALISQISVPVTLAQKNTILTAKNAYDEYVKTVGADPAKVENYPLLTAALGTLETAEKAELVKKFDACPADAAAIAALKAEIEAFNEYASSPYTPSFAALEGKIKDAKFADVLAKLTAVPANATVADEAVVEAARAAFESLTLSEKVEFSADPLNKLYVDRLEAAETAIAVDTIVSVESLKIKASTAAYKGYIRLKWTVTGEAAAADGYQIYRSTKSSSGGKKIYTTKKSTTRSFKNTSVTKGTKYYYKVRAFKVVDGVTYYSDWSTRGIRTAK